MQTMLVDDCFYEFIHLDSERTGRVGKIVYLGIIQKLIVSRKHADCACDIGLGDNLAELLSQICESAR